MSNLRVSIVDADDGTSLGGSECYMSGDVMLVMIKRGPDGALIIEDYEPSEIDKHPDTLGQIGAHIVDFAK